MSKILRKTATFVAALALLAAPVISASSAQAQDLYIRSGSGGGGGGTDGTAIGGGGGGGGSTASAINAEGGAGGNGYTGGDGGGSVGTSSADDAGDGTTATDENGGTGGIAPTGTSLAGNAGSNGANGVTANAATAPAGTGNGGAGAGLTYTLSTNAGVINLLSGLGGEGGAATAAAAAGSGGSAGDITLNINTGGTSFAGTSLTATAGDAGDGGVGTTGTGGLGGNGGTINVLINSVSAFSATSEFTAGTGGAGVTSGDAAGTSGNGGTGGSVNITSTADLNFAGLALTAGNGGAAVTLGAGTDGVSGAGGSVIFSGTNVIVNGALAVTSGESVATGGTGGTASFSASALYLAGTSTLDLERADDDAGQLNFNVAEVIVETASAWTMAETKVGTSAGGDGVYVGSITLGHLDNLGKTDATKMADLSGTAVAGTDFGFGGTLNVIGAGQKIDGTMLGATVKQLNFILPYDISGASGALLIASTDLDISGLKTASQLTISTDYYLDNLVAGVSSITLVDGVTGASIFDNVQQIYTMGGTVYAYDFDVVNNAGDLVADFTGISSKAGAMHSFAMGAMAPSLLLGSGVSNGASMISQAVQSADASRSQFTMMASISGTSETMQLNSDIHSNHFNLSVGPAYTFGTSMGAGTVGAFFEAGWSKYDVNNDSYALLFNGSGDAHYFGGGIAAGIRMSSGFHADGSIAAGRVTNNFSPEWMPANLNADYELKATYLNGHLGLGYQIPFNEKSSLDIYGKLLWVHQFASDTTNEMGELLEFDAFDNTRSRLGVTYNYAIGYNASMYVGLAWEYQFRSEQDLFVDGFEVDPAVFQGHTGIAELGFNIKATDNVSIGLDLMGSLGQRQGFGGKLSIGVSF